MTCTSTRPSDLAGHVQAVNLHVEPPGDMLGSGPTVMWVVIAQGTMVRAVGVDLPLLRGQSDEFGLVFEHATWPGATSSTMSFGTCVTVNVRRRGSTDHPLHGRWPRGLCPPVQVANRTRCLSCCLPRCAPLTLLSA